MKAIPPSSLQMLGGKNAAVYSQTRGQKASLASGIKYLKCPGLAPNELQLSNLH